MNTLRKIKSRSYIGNNAEERSSTCSEHNKEKDLLKVEIRKMKNHLVRSNFAIAEFLPMIQRWSGTRPLESDAFIFAPYWRSSSTMPMSVVRQARWSREQPSEYSFLIWSLLLFNEFKHLDDWSRVLTAKQAELWLKDFLVFPTTLIWTEMSMYNMMHARKSYWHPPQSEQCGGTQPFGH